MSGARLECQIPVGVVADRLQDCPESCIVEFRESQPFSAGCHEVEFLYRAVDDADLRRDPAEA